MHTHVAEMQITYQDCLNTEISHKQYMKFFFFLGGGGGEGTWERLGHVTRVR